jgi:hypothetical protein
MATTTTPIDYIVGDLIQRRGDRLPLLGLALESDTGIAVNLTGAVCTLMLRHQDGLDALTIPHPGISETDGWLHLPAFIYDPPNGIIVYDWPQAEVSSLQIGVLELIIEASWAATGERITVPSDRSARLIVRPSAWPEAPDMWFDTDFVSINTGGDYSTLGTWNTSVIGEVHGP